MLKILLLLNEAIEMNKELLVGFYVGFHNLCVAG